MAMAESGKRLKRVVPIVVGLRTRIGNVTASHSLIPFLAYRSYSMSPHVSVVLIVDTAARYDDRVRNILGQTLSQPGNQLWLQLSASANDSLDESRQRIHNLRLCLPMPYVKRAAESLLFWAFACNCTIKAQQLPRCPEHASNMVKRNY